MEFFRESTGSSCEIDKIINIKGKSELDLKEKLQYGKNNYLSENCLSIKNVDFFYASMKKKIIKNINIDIKKGEFIVLTGASGCGKTTITRIINGLALKFYEGTLNGEVKILNRDIDDYKLWEIGKVVGSIFQDPRSQFFASTSEDEIAFGCENYGVKYDQLLSKVSNSLTMINGENLKGKDIYPMSSGEKQKIAIASIYAVNPSIYVFDEPSANLDMYSVNALKKLMESLKNKGHTIIVSEHRLYYLRDLADRFIYLKDGQIESIMNSNDFINMDDLLRKSMGLRSCDLKRIQCNIPRIVEHSKVTVSVNSLIFSYKNKKIFSNISFRACAGEIIAICGHNGIGKTTLTEIICGLKKEKGGCILFNGKRISPRRRRDHAYFVMQDTDCSLFGDSVEEELLLNCKDDNNLNVENILKDYNLLDIKDNHPASLSGGQKQRLSLAVSDVIDSEIVILDEPTSGLDYKNMTIISEHLKELASKGKTIFIITHDYEFASMTCNKVLHLVSPEKIDMFNLDENNFSRLYECLMSQ